MKINIQKQIAMLRKRNNMTQAELAEKLSISYQAVSQWENGNTFPDITMLPEIAKIFNVSIDALFNEENSSNIDLSFPFNVKNDTLYVVVSKGNKVLTMNEANKIVRDNNFINDEKIVVNIKGEVLNVQSALSLKCENVN
ncbi:MAG: helix-turn-helix transcriptional regulator, partial [Bacilli bacterium]|nr:helix-turn-helix transcriptional regulator [Bacilli bacterium]